MGFFKKFITRTFARSAHKKIEQSLQNGLNEYALLEQSMLQKLRAQQTAEHAKLALERNQAANNKQIETKKVTDERVMLLELQKQRELEFKKFLQIKEQDIQLLKAALYACAIGEVKLVNAILNRDAGFKKLFMNLNPLHIAAEYNQCEVIDLLTRKGINIFRKNYQGQIALDIAEACGNEEAASLLKQSVKASDALQKLFGEKIILNNTDKNVKTTDLNCAEKLIAEGGDINATNKEGLNCLQLAILNERSVDDIRALVNWGADLEHYDNKLNQDALQIAKNLKKDNIIECLNNELKARQHPNFDQDVLIKRENEENKKSLEVLTSIANAEKQLFKHAAAGDISDIYNALVHMADINSVDDRGYNALQIAILNKRPLTIIQYLVELGIDVYYRDKDHKTALELADNQEQIKRWLINEHIIDQGLNTIEKRLLANQSYQRNVERVKQFLQKYSHPLKRCHAMLVYYRFISGKDVYAFYVWPEMLMFTEVLNIVNIYSHDETVKPQIRAILDVYENFFIESVAFYKAICEVGLEVCQELAVAKEKNYIFNSFELKRYGAEIALRLKVKNFRDNRVLDELFKNWKGYQLLVQGIRSYLENFLSLIHVNDSNLIKENSEKLAKALLTTESRQAIKDLTNRILEKERIERAGIIRQGRTTGLIILPQPNQLPVSINGWQGVSKTTEDRCLEAEIQLQEEKKTLLEHLLRKLADLKEYIVKLDQLIQWTYQADLQIDQQTNQQICLLQQQLAQARVSLAQGCHEAKRKLERKVTNNLVGIAVGAVVAPYLAPALMSAIGAKDMIMLTMLKGSIASGFSATIGGRNPLQAATQGALFAAIGCGVDGGLKNVAESFREGFNTVLNKEIFRTVGVTGVTALVSTAINGGKPIHNALISMGASATATAAFPRMEASQDALKSLSNDVARVAGSSALVSVASRSPNLVENLLAASFGISVSSLAESYNPIQKMVKNLKNSSEKLKFLPKSNLTKNFAREVSEQPKIVKEKVESLATISSDQNELNAIRAKRLEELRQEHKQSIINQVTKNIYHASKLKGIRLPENKIREKVKKDPIFQGSQPQIQNRLIKLGKQNAGQPLDDRSAFRRGLETAMSSILKTCVPAVYASEIGEKSREHNNIYVEIRGKNIEIYGNRIHARLKKEVPKNNEPLNPSSYVYKKPRINYGFSSYVLAGCEGVNEVLVDLGTFIGEETARFILDEKTKTGQLLKSCYDLIVGDLKRSARGEDIIIYLAMKEIGSLAIDDIVKLYKGEQTFIGINISNLKDKYDRMPTPDVVRNLTKFGTECLVGGVGIKGLGNGFKLLKNSYKMNITGRISTPVLYTNATTEGIPLLHSWEKFRTTKPIYSTKGPVVKASTAQETCSISKTSGIARDRIQHESLKTCYRQQMGEPYVIDEKLKKVVGKLYRPNGNIGSGSTADAIRFELATGEKVGGRLHNIKGINSKTFLENWLKNNPTANSADRAAVENILLDLKDALGDKLWYSKTIVPK